MPLSTVPNDAVTGTSRLEQDADDILLYVAYDRLALSLFMTIGVTFVFGGLLWKFFPGGLMSAWMVAILAVVAGRFALLAAFKRVGPSPSDLPRWRTYYLIGSALAGGAWSLGPTIVSFPAGSAEIALFVGTLLSVSAVAVSTQASQQNAMQAFVIAALSPAIVAIWMIGGDVEHVIALVLAAGMISLLIVGRRSSQLMRTLVVLPVE